MVALLWGLWGKLKVYLIVAALAAAVAGGIYAKGRIDAAHKAEKARLEQQLEDLAKLLYAEREARRQDYLAAQRDAEAKADLERRIEELDQYVDELEDRDRVCLDDADAERLRKLWP